MFQPLSACRRFALLTVLLYALAGCQIPTDSRALTAPRATQHMRVDLRDFRPSGAWLWDGPSECIRRDLSVPGAYDSATVFLFAIAAPSGEKLRSSVQLQYDRNKRLVLYREHRDYALHLGGGLAHDGIGVHRLWPPAVAWGRGVKLSLPLRRGHSRA